MVYLLEFSKKLKFIGKDVHLMMHIYIYMFVCY